MGTYKDERGYLRSKKDRKLVHRKIAYREHKRKGDSRKFSSLVVHHKDGNKLNNHPSNLNPMTSWEHETLHNPLKWERDYDDGFDLVIVFFLVMGAFLFFVLKNHLTRLGWVALGLIVIMILILIKFKTIIKFVKKLRKRNKKLNH